MRSLIPRLVPMSACAALCLAAWAPALAGAQIMAPSSARNIVYAEVGGAGGLFSLNYERLTEEGIYVRGGTGFWGITNLDNVREDIRTIVAGASQRFDISDLLGQGAGRIAEAGVAVVAGTYKRTRYDVTEVDGTYASLVPTVGLRAEPPAGGFTYRVTVTPLLPIVNSASAFPRSAPTMWAGISAGYIFR
ncbi:MAG: hypothetical protein ABJA80_08645 [bacterium]